MIKKCIFCKIIKKEIPLDIVFESKDIIAFYDIHPKAKIHILILPKKHIVSVKHLKEKDKELIGKIILTAQKIARKKKLKGYKLIINVGSQGGQLIPHLHLHLLSGKLVGFP